MSDHVTTFADSSAEGGLDRKVRDRFFADGRPGVFVDVGAARPDYLSMSASFRRAGWRVIAIEPNPEFLDLHRRLGHEVYPYACGDHDEDGVDFQVVDSQGAAYRGGAVSYEAFSSLAIKKEFAAIANNIRTKTIQVDLRRLDTILKTHAPEVGAVDILSIDVEGWELEVLAGFDLTKHRPRCVILENLFCDRKYIDFMVARGYKRWRCVPPNDVYVPRDTPFWPAETAVLRIRDRLAHWLAHWLDGRFSRGAG